MPVPLILGMTVGEFVASLSGAAASTALALSFDGTSKEICSCLAVVDESVKQIRDAILGRDIEKQSDTRGLCCG